MGCGMSSLTSTVCGNVGMPAWLKCGGFVLFCAEDFAVPKFTFSARFACPGATGSVLPAARWATPSA